MEAELAVFLWIFLSRNFLPYLTTNSYGGIIPILLLSVLSRNPVKKDATTTATPTTTELSRNPVKKDATTTATPTTTELSRNPVKEDATTTPSPPTTDSFTTPTPTNVPACISCETIDTNVTGADCAAFGCLVPSAGSVLCVSDGAADPITCGDLDPRLCLVFGCTMSGDGTSCTPAAQLLDCSTIILPACAIIRCCTVEQGVCSTV